MQTNLAPGLVAGTWEIDPVHSEVSFTVRHLMVSKVRGVFTSFSGAVVVAEDALQSTVNVSIDVASISTSNEMRDNHLRSADYFEAEKHPTMTFTSTSIRPDGDTFVLTGDLSLHGITHPIDLKLEFNGVEKDPWGGTRAGFTATGELNRSDFGVDLSVALDGGGVVVSDKVKVDLEIQTVFKPAT